MIQIDRVFKLRDKLCHSLAPYCGCDLEGDLFEKFVADLTKALPKGISSTALYLSARVVMGAQLDLRGLYEFAWRLAGNIDRLKDDEAIIPWVAQPAIELMPVQVLSYLATTTQTGTPSARFQLRVLAGRACPLKITKTWLNSFVSYVARRELGFTRRSGSLPYHDPSEFVRLRFLANIDPTYCFDGRPGFDQIKRGASCLTWNKRILKLRQHSITPCPAGFIHPCHSCWIGYDRCEAAVHPRTHEMQKCSGCGQESAQDSSLSEHICSTCLGKTLING